MADMYLGRMKCPRCGELVAPIMLDSLPPQYSLHCWSCDLFYASWVRENAYAPITQSELDAWYEQKEGEA